MFVFYWVLVCSQNIKSKNLMSKNRSQIPANYLTSIFLGTLAFSFLKTRWGDFKEEERTELQPSFQQDVNLNLSYIWKEEF